MKKKSETKLGKGKKTEVSREENSRPGQLDEGKKNQFDFGGLPSRDLKKNLGCG